MSGILSLRMQADSGEPSAQLQLARILMIGRLAPRDPALAMTLLNAACAQNFPPALLFHATLAALGFGRPQSYTDAIRLVAEAAATGDERAMGQLNALGGVEGYDPATWFAPAPVTHHRSAPRIFTVEDFIPEAACSWLIDQAGRNLQQAKIKHPKTGVSMLDPHRTNSGAGFSAIESDLVVQMICLRVAAAIGAPLANQEPTNVLHYAQGQEYKPHFDFVAEGDERMFGSELRQMGQRVCTVLIYLNEDYEGGETSFPRVDFSHKGKTGDALIFWNISESGQREINSLHAGMPVTAGEKWLFSKWVREKPVPLI